jgi:gluconokinase
MTVILMGVCGCGKTAVGRALAQELGWTFLDADDFHPAASVAKMAAGTGLTDDDRWPWLERLVAELRAQGERGQSAVLACSALRAVYRQRLDRAPGVRWVYLKGDTATIAPRLAARRGHYMPASLLASQFAALEEPAAALAIDIRLPIPSQVEQIVSALQLTA